MLATRFPTKTFMIHKHNTVSKLLRCLNVNLSYVCQLVFYTEPDGAAERSRGRGRPVADKTNNRISQLRQRSSTPVGILPLPPSLSQGIQLVILFTIKISIGKP